MEELTHLMGVGAVTSTGLTGAASRAGAAAWFPRPLGKRLFCLLGASVCSHPQWIGCSPHTVEGHLFTTGRGSSTQAVAEASRLSIWTLLTYSRGQRRRVGSTNCTGHKTSSCLSV